MQDPGQDEFPDDADAGDPRIAACVAVAVAAGGWVATDATSGVVRMVCGLVTLAASGCAVYLIGLLLWNFALGRALDNLGRVRTEGVRHRIPWFLWLVTPTLIISWAVGAWLYGYDASQWLWTGISVASGTAAIGLAGVRKRRDPVPDGLNGPRHRRQSDH